MDQEIAQMCREKEAAVDRQDFEAAAALRNKEKQLKDGCVLQRVCVGVLAALICADLAHAPRRAAGWRPRQSR